MHTVAILFRADQTAVRRMVSASIGTLTEHRGRIRLDAQIDDLPAFARDLARLPLDFEIVKPKALKTALLSHVQHLLQAHG